MTKQDILRLAEFDLSLAKFKAQTFANNNAAANINVGNVMLGMELENARLQPLIAALIEDRERLRDALGDIYTSTNGNMPGAACLEIRTNARLALAASDLALEKLKASRGKS